MKPLSTLLLLLPSLAGAGSNDLYIASGSMTVTGSSAHWSATGADFSTGGSMDFVDDYYQGPIGAANLFNAQFPFIVQFADDTSGTLSMELTVAGVGYGYPPNGEINGGGASVMFSAASLLVTHGAGSYSAPFTFAATLDGAPGTAGSCITTQCAHWNLYGQGTLVAAVVPYAASQLPNTFYVDKATLTFNTREPATLPLLLLGVAAVGLGSRRRHSAERPPSKC